MKNIFKLSGIIALITIIGFLFACGNGSTDTGTAPVITDAITVKDEPDAFDWITTTSFKENADIWISVKCEDPDGDIKGVGVTVVDSAGEVYSYPEDGFHGGFSLDGTTKYTGHVARIQIGKVAGWTSPITVKIYLYDSKGNKSNTATTNTFTYTL